MPGILVRLDGTEAVSAGKGLTRKLKDGLPPLRQMLTHMPSYEMIEHERLSHRLAMHVFFADRYSPCKCETNENTSRLQPQYLRKGTDVSGYPLRTLNVIDHRLNT